MLKISTKNVKRSPDQIVSFTNSIHFFLDGFVLLWKKGDQFLTIGDVQIVKNDPRIQLIRETNENGDTIGNSLVISSAEGSDAGDYVCQVSTFKPVEIKHSVKIRGKQQIFL